MKNVILLTTLLFSLYSCGQQPHQSNWTTNIDQLFEHVTDHTPGYMVSVIKDEQILYNKGYGMATLEHSIQIDEHSSFNIASLSKQFTAAAIAHLILEDRLTLEHDVKSFFPASNFEIGEMQIKHLIYMTSGINDYMYNDRKNKSDWSSLNYFNVDTAIAASFSTPLMYKPGTQWSYSNINYMLLAKIVEKISGQSFAEFCKERLFLPLGMSSTLVNDDIFQIIPNRAHAYNYRDAENTEWLMEDGYLRIKGEGFLQINRNSPHYGGSGVYTSMEDYTKWMMNYHTKKVWGTAFYDLMHKTMKFDHDKTNDGFGIVHAEKLGEKITWYEGGDWGYSSYFIHFVDLGLSVVCFSNLGSGNTRNYVNEMVDILNENGLLSGEK